MTQTEMFQSKAQRRPLKPWEWAIFIIAAITLVGLVVYLAGGGGPSSGTQEITSSSGTTPYSSGSTELETAELIVRPGISDFGFPVGQLFKCLRSTDLFKSLQVRNTGTGQFIAHITNTNNQTFDLYFRRAGLNLMLLAGAGGGGVVDQNWNSMYSLVLASFEACKK